MKAIGTAFYMLGRGLDRVLSATQLIAVILLGLMMLHVVFDVGLRYVTLRGLPATVEIVSNYYMVGLAFLPLAFAEKRNGHIVVEVLTQNLPMRGQRFTLVLTWLLSAVVFALLAHRGFIDAEKHRATGNFVFSQGLRLPIWPCYYFIPVGFGLLTLALVYRSIATVLGLRDGVGFEDPLTSQRQVET